MRPPNRDLRRDRHGTPREPLRDAPGASRTRSRGRANDDEIENENENDNETENENENCELIKKPREKQ